MRREESTWNVSWSKRKDRVQFRGFWHQRVDVIFTLVAQQSLLFELCLEGKQTSCCAHKKDPGDGEEPEVQILMTSVSKQKRPWADGHMDMVRRG